MTRPDGVARALHLFDHRQHPRRRPAVQRARHRPDRTGERRRRVRARRGDHPSGERRGVEPVLGGRDPVGVDGADVRRVRLAPPARHEPLGDRRALVDASLRHRRYADAARRLRDVRQRHHRRPRQVLPRLVVGDVEQRLVAPVRREHRQPGLDVDPHVTAVHRDRERLGGRQPRPEATVDEQGPDVAEGHTPGQLLDVHAAVAQCPAVAVRLGDPRAERDVPLQPGAEPGGRWRSGGRGHHCPPRRSGTGPSG